MPVITKTKTTGVPPKPKKESNSLLSQAEDLVFDEGIGLKIALYGRAGTGKTTLASTFPGKILYITCSGGANTIGELRSVYTREVRQKMKRINIESSIQLGQLADELAQDDSYSSAVLDTATNFQHLILKEILELDELPPQLSWGIATQQQWGQCSLQTQEYLRKLLNIPKNVIIIAQEREYDPTLENGDAIMPYVGPALTPKAAGWLNAAVDYLGQTFIRKKTEMVINKVNGKEVKTKKTLDEFEYCLRVGPHDMFITKFRIPKNTQTAIVNPTYDKIIKMLLEGGAVV